MQTLFKLHLLFQSERDIYIVMIILKSIAIIIFVVIVAWDLEKNGF